MILHGFFTPIYYLCARVLFIIFLLLIPPLLQARVLSKLEDSASKLRTTTHGSREAPYNVGIILLKLFSNLFLLYS
ncbi:hypothetical protein LguiB_015863 [Lonicera macranthoides]